MPLVRLLRIIPAMLLFPLGLFSISSSLPIVFLVSVLMGYHPAALADTFFARKLGIRIPTSVSLVLKKQDYTLYWQQEWTKYLLGYSTAFGRR